jgi:hypothetical protein
MWPPFHVFLFILQSMKRTDVLSINGHLIRQKCAFLMLMISNASLYVSFIALRKIPLSFTWFKKFLSLIQLKNFLTQKIAQYNSANFVPKLLWSSKCNTLKIKISMDFDADIDFNGKKISTPTSLLSILILFSKLLHLCPVGTQVSLLLLN